MQSAKKIKEAAPSKKLVSIHPDATITGAMDLMREHKIHHLIVLEDEKLLGIISSHDIVHLIFTTHWYGKSETPAVRQVMHMNVPVITETTDIKTALYLMLREGLTAIPLESNGKITGVFTENDMLKVLEAAIEKHQDLNRYSKSKAILAHPLTQNIINLIGEAGI